MNVRDLISVLSGYDGDTEVLLASDEEGNSFNTLYCGNLYFIEANADKHGSVDEILSPEEVLEDGEQIPRGPYEPRVVLWP